MHTVIAHPEKHFNHLYNKDNTEWVIASSLFGVS